MMILAFVLRLLFVQQGSIPGCGEPMPVVHVR
jgi:hypothetical protein